MASTNDNVVAFSGGSRPTGRRGDSVPARLKNARVANRLNQAELGAAIEKTRQAISSYELGEKTPEAGTLASIARVLN